MHLTSILTFIIILLLCITHTFVDAQCNAGQYLNGDGNCVPCDTGYYCTDGTNKVACAAGTANPNTGASGIEACVACDNGHYSTVAGSATCTICPVGRICPNKNQLPQNSCSGQTALAQGQTSCTPCPAGHRCPDPATAPIKCAVGYYTASAGSQTTCLQCGQGSYTDTDGATACQLCPAGSQCSNGQLRVGCNTGTYTSTTGEQSCRACPAGSACGATNVSPTTCPKGTYSPEGAIACSTCDAGMYQDNTGQSTCKACPEGHSCADPAVAPVKCAAGTYSSADGTACVACGTGQYSAAGASTCSNCQAGYYCSSPSSTQVRCAYGYISAARATSCNACSPGTYSNTARTSCTNCPNGSHCGDPLVGPVACTPGTFQNGVDRTVCTPCPAGSFCIDPSTSPQTCSSGYSSSGSAECTPCPYNKDCTNHAAAPSDCAVGSYSPEGVDACSPCPAGSQCRPVLQTCPSGSYSLAGQDSCTVCPGGFSCSNTAAPVACAAGTYSFEGMMACAPCPAGHKCPDPTLLPSICPDGQYSVGGVVTDCTPCSQGNYCADKTVANETPCPQGYYSLAGQKSCTKCPAGVACTTRVGYSPTICAPGTYSIGGAAVCTDCPAGSFCSDPTQLPQRCAPGWYSEAAASECTLCPEGHSCADPSQAPQECGVGTYAQAGSLACKVCSGGVTCGQGATGPLDGDTCPEGSYCPPGTAAPIPCPPGTYGNTPGQSEVQNACFSCTAGKVCEQGSTDITPASFNCPRGHYCPTGTRFSDEFPCPPGTYNPNTGSTSINDCISCTAGSFCNAGTGIIPAGNTCPRGHFCPTGTTHGTAHPCPAGTYNPNLGRTQESDCLPCTAGYFCGQGATGQTPCPRGTWNNVAHGTSAQYCLACPAGWACSNLAMTNPHSFECSTGHYCPEGTAGPKDHPCPAGTYTHKTNLTRIDDCEMCLQGTACEEGTGGTDKTPHVCAQGYYCPGVPTLDPPTYYSSINSLGLGTYFTIPGLATSQSQFPCPPGTYGTFTGATHVANCTECPGGKFCLKASTAISGDCAAGYFCPPGSFSPTANPCPAGSYSSRTDLSNESQCTPCPPGSYCREHATAPVLCPAGSYAPSNNTIGKGPSTASSGKCITCPGGYKCPVDGETEPTPCGAGYYSIDGEITCHVCPAGYYCPVANTSRTAMESDYVCPKGMYCPEGTNIVPTIDSFACPVRNFCPAGTEFPILCPVGTFTYDTGLEAAANCTICVAGYYCLEGSYNATTKCDPGFYCPPGSTGPRERPCPAGRFSDFYGAESADACSVCPAGKHCPPGTAEPMECPRGYYCPCSTGYPEPCPIGTYGNRTGVTTIEGCTLCPPGQYCDGVGEIYPTGPCDAGFYCIEGAYTSQPPGPPSGGLCPRGGYCIVGSESPEPCLPGTFNNFTGGKSTDDCVPCTPGYYCFGSNNPNPTGPCQAGYYCIGSASVATQYEAPAGTYTFSGASTPIPCPQGSYNPLTTQSNCTLCDAGFYCPSLGLTAKTTCTEGSYCPEGSVVPTPCPTGTYSNQPHLKKEEECLPCPPGKYCDRPGLTAPSGDCAEGHYCLGSTTRANPVTSDGNDQKGDLCPAGRFCPNGTTHGDAYMCPQGTYSPSTGNKYESQCLPCIGGMYCPISGIVNPTMKCAEGYYCIAGASTAAPIDGVTGNICPNGTYCPLGSQQPLVCLPKTYQHLAGQSSCLDCPEGFFCDVATGTVNPSVCPPGYYCPPSTNIPVACPVGTYSSAQGLKNSSECILCPGGKYCASAGMTSFTDDCDAGYYCTQGAKSATGTVDAGQGGVGGLCQPGHYCPRGTDLQKQCPPGTYSPSSGNTNVTQCLGCTPGWYCESAGLTAPQGECDPGYYCSGGSASATPAGGESSQCYANTGDLCPVGKYCLRGTITPRPCPAGQFQDTTGQSSCKECPAGFFCNNTIDGTSAPTECLQGYYCPVGSGQFLIECPSGTFSNKRGLTNETGCTLCSGGKVCSVAGLSAPDGDCLKGYYCTSGARTETGERGVLGGIGGTCPSGSYCPDGSSSPRLCPAGTYSPSMGNTAVSDCIPCTPGRYCSIAGLSAPNGECSPGCYCIGGASSACPSNETIGGTCPVGHYCPEGSVTPLPCLAGNYSSVIGRASCDLCPAGNYCPGTTHSPLSCPQGRYCPGGVGNVIPQCPAGTFSNKTDLISQSQCSLCTGGKFCGSEGLAAPDGNCAQGYYCTRGALDNVGTLGIMGGASGVCPKGHYCPESSTIPSPCPRGTFSPLTIIAKEDDCTPCTSGKYCATPGLETPTGACTAGYYCPPGQTTSSPSEYICPAGYYCPEQSIGPIGCPDGTYQPATGKAECLQCPESRFCKNNATVPLQCPATFYCPAGTGDPLSCTNGTYSTVPGLSNSGQCIPCPAGSWCALGSVIGDCSAGFHCKLGSDSPTPNFTPDTDPRGSVCPRGFYCPIGTTTPQQCPPGLFSDAIGAADSSVCGPCGAGYVCYEGSSEKLPCPVGQYCPLGQSVQDCPPGTYNPSQYGKNNSACLACDEGYYCPNAAMQSVASFPCPTGHYCTSGVTAPSLCPAGTYRATQHGTAVSDCTQCPAGHFCPIGSVAPSECISTTSSAVYCPAGSSTPSTCPAGAHCTLRTGSPIDCPAGYYCPVNTFNPIACPDGHYCPLKSSLPIQCPFGYRVRNETGAAFLRQTVTDACELCPAGTYGNDPQRLSCSACAAGYYCETGATHARTVSGISRNVYICPAGYYCLEGSSTPTACPVGEFQDQIGQTSCKKCAVNQHNPTPGSSKCSICGPNSYSEEGAATCTCVGANRVYQDSDRMCLCEPGYIFYNEDFSIGNDSDASTDCQPFIYNRCNTGSATARDLVGNCVDDSPASCTDFCRNNGGSGTINSELGICECTSLVNEDEICDPTCRNRELQTRINRLNQKVEVFDPTTETVISSYAFQAITTGTTDCLLEECEIKAVQMTSGGFLGVYNPAFSYFDNLFNHTQLSTISTNTRAILETSTTPQYIQQTGISQPVVCLSYGSALMWDISHPSKTHYPVYMKDALLNTVPDFDYGPFRQLDGLMRSNLTMTTFIYTFKNPGVFVFHDYSSTSNVMIVRVMNSTESCPSTATFKPITSTNLVTLGIKRRDGMLLAPDWLLVVLLLLAFLIFIAILIIGIHYFRTRTWKGSKAGKAAFRKMLPLSDIESKGIGFAQRQLYTSKQKSDNDAVMEDDPNIVDLEGFSVKLFYDKLQEHKDNVKANMNDYQDEFMQKYNKILEETKEIKDLLGKSGGDSTVLTVDVNNLMKNVSQVSSKEKAQAVIEDLKTQVKKLSDDQANKVAFDPKKSDLDPKDIKRVYNLDLEEDQNRNSTINQYNLLISRLEDRLAEMQDSNDSELGSALDHFNKTLETSKLIIGKSIEKMNTNILEKESIQRKSDDPLNKFNLSDDMAHALKEFLSSQMQNLFEKYTGMGETQEAAAGEVQQKEEVHEENPEQNAGSIEASAGEDKDSIDDELDSSMLEESDTESEPESEDENDNEVVVLQKQQKTRRINMRHKHKMQIQELMDDVDESEKRDAALVIEKLDEHTQRALDSMKDQINRVVKNKDLGTDERGAILDRGRKEMEEYKNKMQQEKSNQIEDLRGVLKKKAIKKFKVIKEAQKAEKEDSKHDDEHDAAQLKKLIESIENDKEKYGEGIQAEIAKQKEILKLKLEMRKNKRQRQQERDRLQLKDVLDKQDAIDRQTEEETIDKIHKNLIGLKKKELEQGVKNHTGSKQEKEALMREYQKELENYKNQLDSKKRQQMDDLEARLKSLRDAKEAELTKQHAIGEQADIKEQENDLNQLKKIMGQHTDTNSSHNAALDDQRRKQAEALQRRMAEMAQKRAQKEKLFEKEEQQTEQVIAQEEQKEKAEIDNKIQKEMEQKRANLDKQLQEDLKYCKTDEEKQHLMRMHNEETQQLQSALERAKNLQFSDMERRLAEKRQQMKKRVQEKKNRTLKEDLEAQEEILNNLTNFAEVEESKLDLAPINISQRDSIKEQELKKVHKEQLQQIQKQLEETAKQELTEFEKETLTEAQRIEQEKESRKKLLKEKYEFKARNVSDEERARIMSEFNNNLENLEKQYSEEAQKQQELLRQRLEMRKQKMSQRNTVKLEEQKRTQEEQERKLKKQHHIKAEKEVITDILSSENPDVNSVQDAIERVVIPRQKRETEELLERQKQELSKAHPDEIEDMKMRHLDERVKLKSEHVQEKKELGEHFIEYEQLLQSRSEQNKEVDEELKKYADQIEAQKRENMKKLEAQKEELKAKMQGELQQIQKQIEEEKARLQKTLEDEKNKLSVKELIKEQEEQMEKMVIQQKNLEEDQRTQLLAQHKANMDAFESALEAERIRQGDILKQRIDEIMNRKLKESEEQANHKVDEEFNAQLQASQEQQQKEEAKDAIRVARSTASLMSMISGRGRARTGAAPGVVQQQTVVKTVAPAPEQPKFTEEQAWLGPIYQKLKDIEALLLSEKRPYVDARDQHIRNEGRLEEVQESALSLKDLVYFKFGQFVIRLLKSKFAMLPEIQLLVAKSLPVTQYNHNAFQNSFFYDNARNTLFIRDTRLTNIGKLIVIVVHCVAHIAIKDMSNDENPLFTKFFYTMLEVVCEDMFLSRQPHAEISDANKERLLQKIAQMAAQPGSTTPSVVGVQQVQSTPLARQQTRSMMGEVSNQAGHSQLQQDRNLQMRKLATDFRNLKLELRNATDDKSKEETLKKMEELKKQMGDLRS